MRKIVRALVSLLLGAAAHQAGAVEKTVDYSVQASATVQENPARITLHWPQDANSQLQGYTIYRKSPVATLWGNASQLPATASEFTDTDVAAGIAYEYQIVKRTRDYTGYGYVCSGIKLPLVDNRGKLLLVVDKTHASELSSELERLQQDLTGDGWTVERLDVARTDAVTNVKARIKAEYQRDPANVKAVFLFGHVPVAYSGDIVPDGHAPDHQGAWPCDGFYGDMDGAWTDTTVRDTRAADARNRNVPGDGKFDQSSFPAPLKLIVGRVDLSKMPGRLTYAGAATFPSEVELLRNYLNKDHSFRHKQFDLPRRGVVGDYFGVRDGEAFAASGWRNLASFFNADNVTTIANEGAWISNLSTNRCLWAYGCGPGSFTSIGGLGNSDAYHDGVTTELYKNDPKAAFTMLFGSWLGDWDSEDNIQRAVLALPSYGLTCACSGRPHWFMHRMALGEPIGYSTRLTQNNRQDGPYRNQQNNCAGLIHIALMGDPALRMHVVAPPANVTSVADNDGTTVSWEASRDSVFGYHVYRADAANGQFTRVTAAPVDGTSFRDAQSGSSFRRAHTYMVKAVKLETSGSGTYYNASQGIFGTPVESAPAPIVRAEQPIAPKASTRGEESSTAAPAISPTGSSTNTIRALSPTGGSAVTNETIWVNDALPAGAVAYGFGGDYWNWVSNTPAPFAGRSAHQSTLSSGLHEHYFAWATSPLAVNTGETMITYVYLDPAALPSELMLSWYDGSWDHRAYWGANVVSYGTDGTSGRRYMGPLPAAGQWVRLEVPASQLGLEGRAIIGMSFSQYNGRATWDYTGKASVTITNTPTTPTNNVPTNTEVWVDDNIPAGADTGSDFDSWNWVSTNPSPFTGASSHQSVLTAGFHQHYFVGATQTLTVATGDVLVAYAYLDPTNTPAEMMLQWNDGSWAHRAYWGANIVGFGTTGTPALRYMGAMPAAGQWVRLEVPASLIGLEGDTLNGMAFTLYGGRATFDCAGKAPAAGLGITNSPGGTNSTSITNSVPGTNNISVTNTVTVTNAIDIAWVDDALPTGAVPGTYGGDSWNWVSNAPAPFSGRSAHQSTLSSGLHEHSFVSATSPLAVNTGETMISYVYLDPAALPSEIMLSWNDGSWEHRAYWGANYVPYGSDGTSGRRYMGPLPAAGRWVRLEVPASQLALEGRAVTGMSFGLYNGRATWDKAGKSVVTVTTTTTVTNGPVGPGGNPDSGGITNTPGPVTNSPGPITNTIPSNTNIVIISDPPTTNAPGTNPPPSTNPPPVVSTNDLPGLSIVDYSTLALPPVGTNAMHILTPTMLELKLINTKQPDPARVSAWDLVDANGNFSTPSPSSFIVTADGSPVSVVSVGFKRRPLYAPFEMYDLRIENSMYLQLATPISDNQTIQVKNPSASLWPATMQFIARTDPLRFNPAIHVNQEGYMPGFTKKAMVGYFAGNLGELNIPASSGFKIVDANTGQSVYQGTLTSHPDVGWTYSPAPYQKVYEADFTSFTTPGEYRLVVPGMGGSLPFLVDNGIAIDFARAYALGLYHQRCGTNTAMPFTRFTHDPCHTAAAAVPWPASNWSYTWGLISNYGSSFSSDNPPQTAPAISASTQLYPFVRQGTIDVSGGHHDAGDYSKYTCNSANLIHFLVFGADSLGNAGALDNLGIPESGDGISDLLQEAKWEADYLAKMQDTDGGFYFLTYPQQREYEGWVTPDKGDAQLVWPKTTSVTAASVAALAQCASSPAFKRAYPATAALYLQKAQLGWQFLMNAIAKYGRTGAYQKITHYGDVYTDQDELAWAACQMFLATGDQTIHQTLKNWFDPSDPATWQYGWCHLTQCYGHAIRSYAFAARSGRLAASALDSSYLAKCEAEIAAAGDSAMNWSKMSAYGTSFPDATKRVLAGGWYFSTDQALDVATAYQLNPKSDYMTALLANMNYEGGCNPMNVSYITGMGWKRQKDIVSQWHSTTPGTLPPSGIPYGNVTASFFYTSTYGSTPEALTFPSDSAATAPTPFYDRWVDGWNVSAEMVVLNQARSLATLAFLAGQTSLKTQPWRPVAGQITVPAGTVAVGTPVTVSLSAPGIDLSSARITWEARDQDPAFGTTSWSFSPKNNGVQWVQAEAQLPDGRRVFATNAINANAPNILWVDDSVPAGAGTGSEGGDSWNWVSSNPSPHTGTKAVQSAISSGTHQMYFYDTTAGLGLATGDVLYAWVYLDPANPPTEIMLQYWDGSWDHRAYWGANSISYGVDGVTKKYMGPLPATGQWVQLRIPASTVNLEGKTATGLGFTAFGGRVTWDTAGRLSSN